MFFDIGATELLLIVIVAIVVIGPKDMPLAFRTAGRWIGKVRRISGHFKSGVESMIREAELDEMDKKWREQNEAIMAAHPNDQMRPLDNDGNPGRGTNQASVENAMDEPALIADEPFMDTRSAVRAPVPTESGSDEPTPPLDGLPNPSTPPT